MIGVLSIMELKNFAIDGKPKVSFKLYFTEVLRGQVIPENSQMASPSRGQSWTAKNIFHPNFKEPLTAQLKYNDAGELHDQIPFKKGSITFENGIITNVKY